VHAALPAARCTVETGGVDEKEYQETAPKGAARYVFAGLRLALGWTFLWAFLDKTFGLGFATEAKGAWINGGHPTKGFLSFAATGPFKDFCNSIAGAAWADWLFMVGLLGFGKAWAKLPLVRKAPWLK
jgi:thiosulfate dehydrogenase (quinone) large subunit